jgi:hypothetical protein
MLSPQSEQQVLEELRRLVWAYVDINHHNLENPNLMKVAGHEIYARRENAMVKDVVRRNMVVFQRTGRISKTAYYRFIECVQVLNALRQELPLRS